MLLSRVFKLLRGDRRLIVLSVVFGLLFSGLGLVPPLLIRQMVLWVRAPSVEGRDFLLLGLLVLVVYVLRGVCRYLYGVFSHVAAYRTLHRMMTTVYEHLQRQPAAFYSREQSGNLVSRSVGDIEAIEDFIAHGIPETLLAVVIPAAMACVLFSINARLAFVVLLPLPMVAALVYGVMKSTKRSWRGVRSRIADVASRVQDNFSGMADIQSFVREREKADEVRRASAAYRDRIIYANKWSLVPPGVIETASGAGLVLVVGYGGLLAERGTLLVADLVVFLMYLGQIFLPFLRLANLTENLQKAAASAERVFALLDTQPTIVEAADARAPNSMRWDIEFDDVTFGYTPETPVLRNVSFAVEPGERVALVGPTGVGKTTATKLVPRFYDVAGGAVRVGGHDVRRLKLDFLRANVAMVLQDVFLFHGTVRENLLVGHPEATERELREAARIANAEQFILALPQQYDTPIGERGVRLSGGQKQRLSIARAVLKNAPILLLDEATSAVDAETESLIQEALIRLAVGRTLLVIAHRLSTIRNADRIVVLVDGQVDEMGSHDELMERDGYYARMYRLQASSGQWQIGAGGRAKRKTQVRP